MLPARRSQAEVSLETAYQRHRPQLLAHLTRLLHDREAAEDLCQETFIKALRNWEQRLPGASLSSWLYRIATNTAYDELRRRRRISFTPLLDDGAPLPLSDDAAEPRIHESEPIREALAQLPALYRVPLLLHSVDGRSTQEIATALGCSNSAVKTRLFRARERFRQVYRD